MAKVIRNKATELASKLSDALASLFPGTAEIPDHSGLASWGEDSEAAEKRHSQIESLFIEALEIKSISVTTEFIYELEIFPPGNEPPPRQEPPKFHMFDC